MTTSHVLIAFCATSMLSACTFMPVARVATISGDNAPFPPQTKVISQNLIPLVLPGPPLSSPPGGGCLPFASLVPPGPNPPETTIVADVLFRAGYVIVKVENGRTDWRCARASVISTQLETSPRVRERPPLPNYLPALARPQEAISAAEIPQTEARALVKRLLPNSVSDRDGWAADIVEAFAALSLPPTLDQLCAVIAVIGQESGFESDPIIPGLGKIAEQELERRRQQYGILMPRAVMNATLEMKSPDGHTYKERISGARTERQLSAIYEDFIATVPLGEHLLGRYNPIRTLGPMQVSFDFITEYTRQHPVYVQGQKSNLRAVAFSRPGGIYFGAAHLFGYRAPYDDPIYRFADYNAGRYASRNAALQGAISRLSGIRLTLDGALALPGDSLSDTARAALALAPRLELSRDQILSELRLGRAEALENTELYRRVFKLVDERGGAPLPRAILPQIKLTGPKIQRNYLTTAWFAERVNSRYRSCLARNIATTTRVERPPRASLSESL